MERRRRRAVRRVKTDNSSEGPQQCTKSAKGKREKTKKWFRGNEPEKFLLWQIFLALLRPEPLPRSGLRAGQPGLAMLSATKLAISLSTRRGAININKTPTLETAPIASCHGSVIIPAFCAGCLKSRKLPRFQHRRPIINNEAKPLCLIWLRRPPHGTIASIV